MAKIEVHFRGEILAGTFDSEDIITVATDQGVNLIADSKAAILKLKLTWEEYHAISLKVHQYISTKPEEGA